MPCTTRLRALPLVLSSAVLLSVALQSGASAAPAAPGIDAGDTNFGSTVQLQPQEKWVDGIARVEGDVGHLGNVRIFQTVPSPGVLQAVGSRNGIFSFDLPPAQVLAGTYDAQFRAFFAAAPKDHTTWWNYFHEADVAYQQGRITDLAQFRAASAHVAALGRAAGNARLQNAVILVGWSANPYSGVNIADYLPNDRTLVDVIAYDNYNDGAIRQGMYGDPTNMVNYDRSAAAALGKPFAVAEFGSVVLGSDYAGRAAWIRSFSQVAATNGAQFVSYFNSDQYGQGNEFRLLDQPSQDSYRAVLSSSRATAPAMPLNVTVTSGSASASTAWQAPNENGSPITGFTVTATDDGSGSVTTMSVGADATTATLAPLTNGRTYTVRVSATNGIGTGPVATVSGVLPGRTLSAPGAPVAGAASVASGSASLSWTAPVDNGGSSVSGYTLTAVDTAGGSATTATTSADGRTATVTGLTNGRSYSLAVVATNSVGDSASSAASVVTPYGAPGAPTVGAATRGNASASVTWSAPASNGGAPITGYTVTAVAPSAGTVVATTQVDGSQTSATVPGLVNGKSYALTVTANNGIAGPASARSNVVVPATVAAAPATHGYGGSTGDAVVSATAWWYTPTSNGGSPVTGYRVTTIRYDANGQQIGTQTSALQPGSARLLQVTGLVAKGTYRFTVTAYNGVGASTASALSELATAR